jgi:hypothetical protein
MTDPYQQFADLRAHHQWCGTVMTRDDVDDLAGRPLTDDEWERVADSWAWRRGIVDIWVERANEMIADTLHDLDITTAWDLEGNPEDLDREIAFATATLDDNDPRTGEWLAYLLDLKSKTKNSEETP